MENKIIKCFITIFLGWLGIHKFMEKKKSVGILYLCTMGLFGIGWIIDSINSVKELMNVFSNDSIEKEKKDLNMFNVKKDSLEVNDEETKIRLKKLNELKNRTVKVIGLNGEEKDVKQYKNFLNENDNVVLLSKSDGDNKIYHLWYDCYESWNDEYKSKFQQWEEADYNKIEKEYSLCKRCQESCYRYDNPNSTITGYSFKYYYDEYIDIEEIDYTYLLSQREYKILESFDKLKDFSKIYKELKMKNKYFKKNDVLWSIYNDLRLKYEFEKDMSFLGIIFEHQTEILMNDRKYQQAIETYLTSLYCYLFHYEISTKEVNLIDRHFNIGRKEQLTKLMKKTSYDKSKLKEEFNAIIVDNIPSLYIEEKSNYIIKNIIERIK